LLADEAARHERLRAQQRAQRDADEFDRLLKAKEAARKAKEAEQTSQKAKEEDRKKWERIAEEEQRQKAEAEARKRAVMRREEDEARAAKVRLDRERPAIIMAPSRAEYEAAKPSMPPQRTPTSGTSTSSPAKKFGLFKRRREDASPTSPMMPKSPLPRDERPKTSLLAPNARETVRPGGGGIVPLSDAPVSAVNHGERRVRIEYGKSSVTLPVTPTTSALQLIRSASTCMSEAINPRASVMLEVFAKAGVRRPLRMYEHIRDVMNSWDDDEQHSLVIEASDVGADNELYVSFAPKQKPADVSWWLYYSTKPQKWEKKWITLHSDGQISLAKNELGKELASICHVSDFDIYAPTSEQRRKKIKPPKKHCYAVKSQQKFSMFMTTSNFIHFFCCNDKTVAQDFFSKVQTWRSWYLVNVMGEGQASKGEQKSGEKEFKINLGPGATPEKSQSHSRTASTDSHYMLGSFNTLDFNPDVFKKMPDAVSESEALHSRGASATKNALILPSALEHSKAVSDAKAIHAKRMAQRKRTSPHPPLAFLRPGDSGYGQGPPPRPNTSHNGQGPSSLNAAQGTFNPSGLLGPQYAQRQRDVQQGSRGPPQNMNRSNSIRSGRSVGRRNSVDGGTLNRSGSVKNGNSLPRPLVDLTPQYTEPPQFQKKGKGHRPDGTRSDGRLIDSATSPEVAIPIPPGQDWRARPATSAGPERSKSQHQHNRGPSGNAPRPSMPAHFAHPPSARHQRAGSLRGHGIKVNGHGPPSDVDSVDAFTGGGLLAHSGPGWGSGDRGHGVLSGNQAKGPMVDLAEKSKFANGSLLRKVEEGGRVAS